MGQSSRTSNNAAIGTNDLMWFSRQRYRLRARRRDRADASPRRTQALKTGQALGSGLLCQGAREVCLEEWLACMGLGGRGEVGTLSFPFITLLFYLIEVLG